jgi:hypothetical protein
LLAHFQGERDSAEKSASTWRYKAAKIREELLVMPESPSDPLTDRCCDPREQPSSLTANQYDGAADASMRRAHKYSKWIGILSALMEQAEGLEK